MALGGEFSFPLPQGNASSSRRRIPCDYVSINWVYNRLQTDGGVLCLDARSREVIAEGHILGSIPSPSSVLATVNRSVEPYSTKHNLMDAQVSKQIISAIDREIPEDTERRKFRRRKLVEVIVYGDTDCIEWIQMLCRIFLQEGQVTALRVLQHQYQDFEQSYPFLVEKPRSSHASARSMLHRTISGNHRVTYPNEILPGFLYLGNMWQAQQREILRDLRITHIVNASLDCANEFQDEGLIYYNVNIPDRPTEEIAQFFDASNAFIQHAKDKVPHARVFIHCTQGISRSATLILNYLMQSQHMSLAESYNFLSQRRPVIYPNQGFMQQLREREHELLHVQSVDESEIELLMQGKLPTRTLIQLQAANCKKQCIIS